MKSALFLAALLASALVIAQQAPRAVADQVPESARPRPVPPRAPPMAPPRAPQLSNEELAELLRAQTTAIQSLSSKLDALEDRMGRMEQRGR